MRKSPLLACVIPTLLGAGCVMAAKAPTTAPSTRPSATQPSAKAGPAVNKFCAVEGADNKVDPDVFVMYKGKKVGFCCPSCIKDFNKDPEKYVKNMK